MKAWVFQGPGQARWQEVPDPQVKDPGDAIVRVGAVTVCGTDLHIFKGDAHDVRPGTVLGHEAVGEVVGTGTAVTTVRPGDRVLISCICGCGRCRFCREGAYGQCVGGGGWVLGHLIDGTQAEYVRVPFADVRLHPLPASVRSQDAVLLADIFPTAYEVGVLNGRVRPGDTVAVVGSGPIGLAAIATARLYSPDRIIAIDLAETRLDAAKRLGADAVANAGEQPERLVLDLTEGLGADVVIEAVGVPESFEPCARIVRPGGHPANVGVHGAPGHPSPGGPVEEERDHHHGAGGHVLDPGAVAHDGFRTPPAASLVTHTFELQDMEEAYAVFGRAADAAALKVVLGGPHHSAMALTD